MVNAAAFSEIDQDIAADKYRYFRDDFYDDIGANILERYKAYNNPEGNSPVTGNSQAFSSAATNIPESEDLNRDYSLNESEAYFQYRIHMYPGMDDVNHPYITDVVTADMPLPTAPGEQVNWYQFKIPIEEYDHIQGNIRDFKSIRFVRMFLNDFSQTDAPVVLRFARLELVRNQWRRYQFSLLDPGEYIPNDVGNETSFNVSSVSFEENSSRQPIPYVLPPGIEREEQLGGGAATNTFLQNEQALSMEICALNDGDARAIYKALNIDLRRYRRMQLDVHAEPLIGLSLIHI